MHEVERYGTHADALTLCLAAPEHQRLTLKELRYLDQDLGVRGKVVCLDAHGNETNPSVPSSASSAHLESSAHLDPKTTMNNYQDQDCYTAMRQCVTGINVTGMSQARFVLGGQLNGFKGSMPGIIEESIHAIEAGQPLYVAAGFGGTAALVAAALGIDDLSWAPEGIPTTARQRQDRRIFGPTPNSSQRQRLVPHRTADSTNRNYDNSRSHTGQRR